MKFAGIDTDGTLRLFFPGNVLLIFKRIAWWYLRLILFLELFVGILLNVQFSEVNLKVNH